MRDIAELGELTAAEQRLRRACVSGEWAEVAFTRPEAPAPDRSNVIRAPRIRYLALGRDAAGEGPLHETGVQLRGAWIEGVLDFQSCVATDAVWLGCLRCTFDSTPVFEDARLAGLALRGCHLPGLSADGLRCASTVFLDRGFRAEGETRLSGARIRSDLACAEGTFVNPDGAALHADSLSVEGSVFLSEGFRAEGETRLVGARIGGNLECDKGAFVNPEGYALSAERLLVKGHIFLRDGFRAEGIISFAGARCGALVDEADDWPAPGHLILDGFAYDHLTGVAPTDARRRLDWLSQQAYCHADDDFRPQPYEQCATVLRAMGHRKDAHLILIEKERRQRKAAAGGLRRAAAAAGRDDPGDAGRPLWLRIKANLSEGWSWLLRTVIGYGYHPQNALITGAALIAFATVLFFAAHASGQMAPARPVALFSDAWAQCLSEAPRYTAQCFAARGAGADYETFNALAYAADIVIPLMQFGQDDAWAPAASRGWFGSLAWVMRWALIIAGWVISSLGLAAATGLIKNE